MYKQFLEKKIESVRKFFRAFASFYRANHLQLLRMCNNVKLSSLIECYRMPSQRSLNI